MPGRVRILLLDDEPEVRRVVAAALKRFGHDVLTAADPEEALAAARTEGHRLDLIVSDVRLPNHSGFEAVRTLLPFCPRARVVFTTGAGAEVDVDGDGDAEALQAVWLEKPFSLDELMDAVRRGLAVGPTGRRRTGEGW